MGKTGDKRAVEPLIKKLNDNNDFRSAIKATAIALGKLGDKRAVKPLMEKLNDKDSSVRSAAKEALEKINLNLT